MSSARRTTAYILYEVKPCYLSQIVQKTFEYVTYKQFETRSSEKCTHGIFEAAMCSLYIASKVKLNSKMYKSTQVKILISFHIVTIMQTTCHNL